MKGMVCPECRGNSIFFGVTENGEDKHRCNKCYHQFLSIFTGKEKTMNKHEEGKPDYSVLPWDAMEDVTRVFEYGVDKYGGPFTYKKGILHSKLFNAAIRHLMGWYFHGINKDKESGCHHLAHLAANALMLLSMMKVQGNEDCDDRPINQKISDYKPNDEILGND